MELKNKEILILGEGISGMGAFEALEGIAARLFYYEGCLEKLKPDIVVTSPGIAAHPALEFAAQNNIPVISELELGYLLNQTPVCAVTGTNGKTTVTRLIGEMTDTKYKTVVCGNIGYSFSAAARKPHKLAVVEASSFQLLDCHKFRPNIAVITNISPDHLDRHGDMQSYIKAKLRITKNQTPDDFLICPLQLRPLLKNVRSTVLYLGLDIAEKDGDVYFLGEKTASLKDASITGEHNKNNALMAIAAARLLGVDGEDINGVLQNFKQEPHRLQLVSTALNKHWFDDSKATNIDACLAACRSMNGDTALILGGSDKGYEYDSLFLAMPQNIKEIFIMGAVKEKLFQASQRTNRQVIQVDNLLEAVFLSAKADVKNVLLSPAAASFDNFQNYAHRGRAFLDAVTEVEKNNS